MKKKCCYQIAIVATLLLANFNGYAQITVATIQELVTAAANSNQEVTMTPGTYQMEDYLTPTVIDNTQPDPYNRHAMITFSGSNNTFDFTGVTIEVNTALLNDFGTSVIEFHVTGNNNIINGLTITDIGNSATARGGQSFTVSGDDITVEDVTINVNGSSPYGYGDLLGKGGPNLVKMRKHSGMLIEGLNPKIIGCSIYSQAFGHLFFVQGGRNVLFQDCYAEAVTRTTDEMLAETSGAAFNLDFEAVYRNYDGDKVITPGYTKSLSEVGFRNYGSGANGETTAGVTAINCTVKNARIGFAFEVGGPILIKDCEATGCEGGYNVGDVTIENSRGDAVNGPLLYLNGAPSNVELYLMPTEATTTLHAIATIAGSNHKVTLKKWQGATRNQIHPIIIGATRPSGSNPFSPLGTSATSCITLVNETGMPLEFKDTASPLIVNPSNLAICKTATQSSSRNNDGFAENAIDGNTNGVYGDSSVTHTGGNATDDPQPWWQVDLEASHTIESIDIYNRTDCCTDRLSDFSVQVLDVNGNETFKQTYANAPSNTFTVTTGGVIGSVVRISKTSSTALSLAEVEVYGAVLSNKNVESISNINIYPNPSTSNITITNSRDSELEIYSIIGQLKLKKNIDSDKQLIDISDLSSGIYLAKIKTNGITTTSIKLIKKE